MTSSGQAHGHSYRVFGLTFRSEIALPELREAADGAADFTVERATIPPPVGESIKGLVRTAEGAVYDVPGIARFRAIGGTRIQVDADPSASEHQVRVYLLGSAMGALLHQRGLLPLHANAIDMDGRAIAFCGQSGSGKSTLAAAFHDRGRRLLSDDVCVVTSEHGRFVAQPGIPRVRLWRDAVERSGRDSGDLAPARTAKNKFVLPLDENHAEAPLPLATIYLLSRTRLEETDFTITRLTGIAAAQALARFTYRRVFATDARDHFAACLALSQAVPVFAINRPWDSSRIDELAGLVESHLAGLDRAPFA